MEFVVCWNNVPYHMVIPSSFIFTISLYPSGVTKADHLDHQHSLLSISPASSSTQGHRGRVHPQQVASLTQGHTERQTKTKIHSFIHSHSHTDTLEIPIPEISSQKGPPGPQSNPHPSCCDSIVLITAPL